MSSNHHPRSATPLSTTNLEVGGTGLGELEDDTTASEAAVDLGVGVEAVVNTTTLLLVEDDLEGLGAVLLGAETLADDLDGVDEVGQDSIVDSSESARTGTLLLLGVARASGALGAGKDTARSKDQDVAVRELLLELTGEATGTFVRYEIHRMRKTRMVDDKLTAAERGGSPAGKGRGQR